MKIAVCDDEREFIDNTCTMLQGWAADQNIELSLYRLSDGDELLRTHRSEGMDMIFLDVLMPLFNGIDTARELRTEDAEVPVVFLTSAREYAVESYDVKALGYLLKPLEQERLYSLMNDFITKNDSEKEFVVLRSDVGFCRISMANVEYLEAQNKHVMVYMSDGTSVRLSERFSGCEQMFTAERGFFRSHRSYIVNLSRVEQFTKTQIFMENGEMIPISRNCYPVFKETYFSFMFQ